MQERILVDVDGVAADLMGGFRRYLWDTRKIEFDPSRLTQPQLFRQTDLVDEYRKAYGVELPDLLVEFLRVEDVYQKYVDPVPGAVETIDEIEDHPRRRVVFLTATLEEAPTSFASKHCWLRGLLPTHIPVVSCPSKQKAYFGGNYLIEDRADTCENWLKVQTAHGDVCAFLIAQPWNRGCGYPRRTWEGLRDFFRGLP